jgi:hypothetical protein
MLKLGEMIGKLAKGEFGFKMDEVMTGFHEFEAGAGPTGLRPMEFKVTWGTERLGPWLNPTSGKFMTNDLEGTVSIDGLCADSPCKGRLELRYFDQRRIRYVFDFEVGGVAYQYVGEKVNILPWNLAVSHTTCFGRVTEVKSGKLVSSSVVFFRFSTVPKFVSSLRLAIAK